MVTDNAPAATTFEGAIETIEAGGNTVRGAVLLLVNVVPVVVRPATATRYAVGADTTIVVGTMN